jgi:hypothetical protein
MQTFFHRLMKNGVIFLSRGGAGGPKIPAVVMSLRKTPDFTQTVIYEYTRFFTDC